jgi:hypothetical protein
MAGIKDIVQVMPTKAKRHKEAAVLRDTISSSVFSGLLPLWKADAAAEEYSYQRTRTQQRDNVLGCADNIVPDVRAAAEDYASTHEVCISAQLHAHRI